MSERTDELRRLLDERGVKCHQRYVKYGHSVGWTGSNGYLASAEQWGDALLVQAILTPEQAVDATVGRGACHMVQRYDHEGYDEAPCIWLECDECGGVLPNSFGMAVSYCPNCGRKAVE